MSWSVVPSVSATYSLLADKENGYVETGYIANGYFRGSLVWSEADDASTTWE